MPNTLEPIGTILRRIVGKRVEGADIPPPEPTPPSCQECHGIGWVASGLQVGSDSVWYTQERPCPTCGPVAPGPTFHQFHLDSRYPTLRDAYYATEAWTQGQGPQILVLNAEPGRGKTHLAKSAYRALGDKFQLATWLHDNTIVDQIMATFADHTTAAWLAQFDSMRWLFIDDFGVASKTPTIDSIMDRLIDKRIEAADLGARTLITTNLSPHDLSPRTSSRLRDVRLVKSLTIDAPDFRSSPHSSS
jgi:chromosomal replication initiation ATPase DnaA